MMKHFWKMICIVLVTRSCNDIRLFEINNLPELSILDEQGEIIALDSIKISLKNGTRFYELNLQASDLDNNINSIEYEILQGEINVLQNNLPLSGNVFQDEDGIDLKLEPLSPGRIEIRFRVTDEFNSSVTGLFALVAFNNLPPEALLESRKVGALGDLDYEIDASSSFDADKMFGGGIEKYEYVIDDVTIETRLSKLRHNFRQVGFYVIRLRVQDNDGEWSGVYSREFLIE